MIIEEGRIEVGIFIIMPVFLLMMYFGYEYYWGADDRIDRWVMGESIYIRTRFL